MVNNTVSKSEKNTTREQLVQENSTEQISKEIVENNQISTPEHGVSIEDAKELSGVTIEKNEGLMDKVEGALNKLTKPKKKKKTVAEATTLRDELTKEVEHIMENGMEDAFRELSPSEAQAFKIKGEETAREIRSLLKSTKIKVKKIFALIFEWLKILPGINSFFLEQEAKIKADKIMALHRKQMHHRKLKLK